jgi:asparagine synthase (glutamine-hydrolysing)
VYCERRDRIDVATSLRALLPLLPKAPRIDPAAVHEYLQYSCIPAPRTIYEGVFRLPPGCRLERRRETTITPYWDMSYREAGKQSEDAWAESVLGSVRSAVSLNLTGIDDTQKAGCFLSGGTDSSSIAALIGESTGCPPNTFSIGFDDPRYNEIHYARIAAKRVKARHHEYFVTPGDILNLVHRAAKAYDEPFGNSSIIPTYFCARLAADHGISHLLAGDGGDELFGGNSRYVSDQVFQRYARIPAWMRRRIIEPMIAVAPPKTRFKRSAASYVRRSSIPAPQRYFSYSLVSSFAPEKLFTGDFLRFASENDSLAPACRHWSAADADDDLNRWLYLDLKIIITDNDLRKVTTMSRLAGVQPRYPLLEPTLAELTGSIPTALKVRGSQLRYLFKRAMRDVLPPEIIKKSKHGFGLPFSVWVGEIKPLRDLAFDVLGSAQCRQRGYFRPGILEWLWSQYQNVHRPYYGDLLWVFMMLELWHMNHGSNQQTAGPDKLQPAQQLL